MPPIEDDTPEEEVTKVEKPQATQKQEKPSTKKESTQKPSTKKQDKPSKPSTKPATKPADKPKQQKPSSGYTRQRGVSGTFPKTKLDQDGDGLEDAIQDDVIIGPIEEGVLDPDFDYNLGD